MKHNSVYLVAVTILITISFVSIVTADQVTLYPSTEARLSRTGVNEAFTTINAGAGTAIDTTANATISVLASTTTNQFATDRKVMFIFNTSVPGKITGATLRVYQAYAAAGYNGLGTNSWVTVTSATPDSLLTIVQEDYDNFGSSALSNYYSISQWGSFGGFRDFTFTSTGIEYLNESGMSAIGVQQTWQSENSFNGTWGSSKYNSFGVVLSTYAGTTYDPVLIIDYTIPPTANYNADPVSGTAPLTIQFTDTSTNTPTSWLWDFGDGNSSTSQSPEHIYAFPGSFNVTLSATNAGGTGNTNTTTQIVVSNPLIISDFSGNVTSGASPFPVMFTDLSAGSVNGWAWDFGDGNASDQQNPEYTFLECSRKYNITLEISDTFHSNSTTKTDYITTDDCPLPTLEGDWTFEPVFNFNGTNTTPVTSWNWSFPDGGYSDDQNATHKLFWGVQNFVSLKITNNTMSIFSNKTIDLSAGNGTSSGGARPQVIQQHLIVI